MRQGGKSTAIVSGGRKIVQTTYDDGAEMVEEFDKQSGELLVRKVREKSLLGAEGPWVYEVGDAPRKFNAASDLLVESSANPIFSRKDAKDDFQWRVRNLPYPASTYSVTVDTPQRQIVVRTSNKKYFKRFNIPEMDAAGIPLSEDELSWEYANNTLIISYSKPKAIIAAETKAKMEKLSLKADSAAKEGDVDCKTQ
eukprot:jgi/Mesvir1/18992/Mv18953-RA.1